MQDGNGAGLDGGILRLSQIGPIPVRLHRPLEGTSKTVRISKEADGWSVAFSCAGGPTETLPRTGKETGIEVGLKGFPITAEGAPIVNPRHSRTAEQALKKAQRRVSTRKKGSNRRKKAVRLLARKPQHVWRQRTAFHHTPALALLRTYDAIFLEALRIANMVRNHHLAKSISDAGWAQFRTILEAKAAWAGRQVIAVPPAYPACVSGLRIRPAYPSCVSVLRIRPAYPSQDCSGCGERVKQALSVRPHVCPSCGLVLDRDENAARTIHWRGQRLRGVGAVVQSRR